MNLAIIGIFAALTSAAAWALGSILFKKIGEKVSPFGMTLSKGILGIIMLGFAYAVSGFEFVSFNAAGMLFISGIIGIAIGDTLFFASLQDLGPKVQIIFFMMGQVLTALLGLLILKELPLLLQWIGIAVTLLGAATVLWKKIFSGAENRKTGLRGVILGLLAMLCFSFSLIIAKHAMKDISALSAVLVRMTAGTIGVLIYGIIRGKVKAWLNPFQDLKIALFFIISVSIVTFGGFWLSLVSIKFLDVAVASILGATEPLFVLPLALIMLKERIAPTEIIGAILTACGVIIIIIGSG